MDKISSKIDKYNEAHEIKIKEFEVITIIALIYFAENNCDFVVLETGLGGEYDATNIVNSIVQIITNIGLDHMDILGNNKEEITKAKAGIIKEECDTIIYEQEGVTEIIEKTCKDKRNRLHLIKKQDVKNYFFDKNYQSFDYGELKKIKINLKGECQTLNASLAIECINVLNEKGYNISERDIREGLKSVVHKARFETLCDFPKIIFDGGHNEDAIVNLKKTIKKYYPYDKKIFIISILRTKDYKTVVRMLAEEKGIFIFTSGNDETKYVPKEELYNEAKKVLNVDIYKGDLIEIVKEVKKKCRNEAIFIVRKFLCI